MMRRVNVAYSTVSKNIASRSVARVMQHVPVELMSTTISNALLATLPAIIAHTAQHRRPRHSHVPRELIQKLHRSIRKQNV